MTTIPPPTTPVTHLFGLIGRGISHSFSQRFFREKFAQEGMAGYDYELFDLHELSAALPALIEARRAALRGLNVTMPYKQAIMPFLDGLTDEARQAGAVNAIAVVPTTDGTPGRAGVAGVRLEGTNTDVTGFLEGLVLLSNGQSGPPPRRAWVMGASGGAGRAVAATLRARGWHVEGVGREGGQTKGLLPGLQMIGYEVLAEALERGEGPGAEAITPGQPVLLVNATPAGMYPNVTGQPPVPMGLLGPDVWVYDLIYNPDPTRLMAEAKARGCPVIGGLPMLEGQARAAWAFWQRWQTSPAY